MQDEQNHNFVTSRYTEKDRQDLLKWLRRERFLKVIGNQSYTGVFIESLFEITKKVLDKHKE